MRILYAVHQFFPEGIYGTERFTLNLSSAMRQNGHEVRIATHTSSEEGCRRYRRGLLTKDYVYNQLAVTAFRLRQSLQERRLHSFPLFLKLRLKLNPHYNLKKVTAEINTAPDQNADAFRLAEEILDKYQIQLLHVTHPWRMTPFIFAAIKKKIPYVVTVTDFFLICYRGILVTASHEICSGPEKGNKCPAHCPIGGEARDYAMKRTAASGEILSRAAMVVSPSRYIAEGIQGEFPHIPIKVIPHGVDYKYIAGNNRPPRPRSGITFGFMGNVDEHKGVHRLIEAFKKLENRDCRLQIHGAYGNPSYEEGLKLLRGEDKRIEFCGAYSLEKDAAGILNSIDVLCNPSIKYETQGLMIRAPYGFVFQEALAAGVPVIGAPGIGVPPAGAEEKSEFAYYPGLAGNLYELMDKIVRQPGILDEVKKQISPPRKLAEEVKEYEEMYRKVIGI